MTALVVRVDTCLQVEDENSMTGLRTKQGVFIDLRTRPIPYASQGLERIILEKPDVAVYSQPKL